MTQKETVAVIKTKLDEVSDLEDDFLAALEGDERKSVQNLRQKAIKRIQNQQKGLEEHQKRLSHERAAYQAGYRLVAGVDEVGRGPLAGPVVVAAVILPEDCDNQLVGVTDSKQLSHQKRLAYAKAIRELALDIKIVAVEPEVIDRDNIYQATRQAMLTAVQSLAQEPDYLLLDAMTIDSPIAQESLIKGDQRSLSIAAASIVAKVYRDELMVAYAETYPGFGFERHMGYGTREHLQALETLGFTSIHRRSFEPIKSMTKRYQG